ncbi:MAG: hypothetical protein JNK09_06830 [Prolixibacteraceae bacterium]|nr:hypothetical protein [Prolixibacteraceae bacterium]
MIKMEILNELKVGSRVWTINGYQNQGPIEGPKIDIPPNVGGTIIWVQESMCYLYSVKWDSGHMSKHYYNELFSIGPFRNINDFELALKSTKDAKLTIGPSGGFRGFSMTINFNDSEYLYELSKKENMAWTILSVSLDRQSVKFKTEKLT